MFNTSKFITNLTSILGNMPINIDLFTKLTKFRLNNNNRRQDIVSYMHDNKDEYLRTYEDCKIDNNEKIPINKLNKKFVAEPLQDAEIDELIGMVSHMNNMLKTTTLPKHLQIFGKGTLLRAVETMQNNLRSAFEVINSQHYTECSFLSKHYLECGEVAPITSSTVDSLFDITRGVYHDAAVKHEIDILNAMDNLPTLVIPSRPSMDLIDIPNTKEYVDKYAALDSHINKQPNLYTPPLISLGGKQLTTYEFINEFNLYEKLVNVVKNRYANIPHGDTYYTKFFDMLPYLNMSKLPTPLLHVLAEIYVTRHMHILQEEGYLPKSYIHDTDLFLNNSYSITEYALSDKIDYIDDKGNKYDTLYDLYTSEDYIAQQIVKLFEKELLVSKTDIGVYSYKDITKMKGANNEIDSITGGRLYPDSNIKAPKIDTLYHVQQRYMHKVLKNEELWDYLLSYRLNDRQIVPYNNPNTAYVNIHNRVSNLIKKYIQMNDAIKYEVPSLISTEDNLSSQIEKVSTYASNKYKELDAETIEIEKEIEEKVVTEWFNIDKSNKLMLLHIYELLNKANAALPLYTIYTSFNIDFYRTFKNFANNIIDDSILATNLATSAIDVQPNTAINIRGNTYDSVLNNIISAATEPAKDNKLYPTAQFLYNVLNSNDENLEGLSTYKDILSRSDDMYSKYLLVIEQGIDKISEYLNNNDKIAYYFQGIDKAQKSKDTAYIMRYKAISTYINNLVASTLFNITYESTPENDTNLLKSNNIYAYTLFKYYICTNVATSNIATDITSVNNEDMYTAAVSDKSYRKFKQYNFINQKLKGESVEINTNKKGLPAILLKLIYRLGEDAINVISKTLKAGISDSTIVNNFVIDGYLDIIGIANHLEHEFLTSPYMYLRPEDITKHKEEINKNIRVMLDIINYLTCTLMALEDMLNEQTVLDMTDALTQKVAPKVMLDNTNDAIVLGSSISPAEIMLLQSNYITAPVSYLLDMDINVYDKMYNMHKLKNIPRLPSMLTVNSSHDITKLTDKKRAKMHAELMELEELVINRFNNIGNLHTLRERILDTLLPLTLADEDNFTKFYTKLHGYTSVEEIKGMLSTPDTLYDVLLSCNVYNINKSIVNVPYIIAALFIEVPQSKYSYLDDNYIYERSKIDTFNNTTYGKIFRYITKYKHLFKQAYLAFNNLLNVRNPDSIPYTLVCANNLMAEVYHLLHAKDNSNRKKEHYSIKNPDSLGIIDVSFNSFNKVVGLLSSTPNRHNKLLAKILTKSLLKTNYIVGETYYNSLENSIDVHNVYKKVKNNLIYKIRTKWRPYSKQELAKIYEEIKSSAQHKLVDNINLHTFIESYLNSDMYSERYLKEHFNDYTNALTSLSFDEAKVDYNIVHLLSPGLYNSDKIPVPNKLHFKPNNHLNLNKIPYKEYMDIEYVSYYTNKLDKMGIFTDEQKNKYIDTIHKIICDKADISKIANTDLSMYKHIFIATPTFQQDNRILTTYNISSNINACRFFTGINTNMLYSNLQINIPTISQTLDIGNIQQTDTTHFPMFTWSPYTLKAGDTSYPSINIIGNLISGEHSDDPYQVGNIGNIYAHMKHSYINKFENVETPMVSIHNIIPAVYNINKDRCIESDVAMAYYEKSNQNRYKLGNPKIQEDVQFRDSKGLSYNGIKTYYSFENNPKDNIGDRFFASSILAEHVNLVDELYHAAPVQTEYKSKRLLNYVSKENISNGWDGNKDIIITSNINKEATLHKVDLLTYLIQPKVLNEAMQDSINNTNISISNKKDVMCPVGYFNPIIEVNNPDVIQLTSNPFVNTAIDYTIKNTSTFKQELQNSIDTGNYMPSLIDSSLLTTEKYVTPLVRKDNPVRDYVQNNMQSDDIAKLSEFLNANTLHDQCAPILKPLMMTRLYNIDGTINREMIANWLFSVYPYSESLLNTLSTYAKSDVSIQDLIPTPINVEQLFTRELISSIEMFYNSYSKGYSMNTLGYVYSGTPYGTTTHYPFANSLNFYTANQDTFNYNRHNFNANRFYPKMVINNGSNLMIDYFYRLNTVRIPLKKNYSVDKSLFPTYSNIELPSIEREYSLLNLFIYRLNGLQIYNELLKTPYSASNYSLHTSDVNKHFIYFINDTMYNLHTDRLCTTHSNMFPSYYLTTILANGLQPNYMITSDKEKYQLLNEHGIIVNNLTDKELNNDTPYVILNNPFFNLFNTSGFYNKFMLNSIMESVLNTKQALYNGALLSVYKDVNKVIDMYAFRQNIAHIITSTYVNSTDLKNKEIKDRLNKIDGITVYNDKLVNSDDTNYRNVYKAVLLDMLQLLTLGNTKYNFVGKTKFSELTEEIIYKTQDESLNDDTIKNEVRHSYNRLGIISSVCNSLYKYSNKHSALSTDAKEDSNNEVYINIAYDIPTKYMSKDFSVYTLMFKYNMNQSNLYNNNSKLSYEGYVIEHKPHDTLFDNLDINTHLKNANADNNGFALGTAYTTYDSIIDNVYKLNITNACKHSPNLLNIDSTNKMLLHTKEGYILIGSDDIIYRFNNMRINTSDLYNNPYQFMDTSKMGDIISDPTKLNNIHLLYKDMITKPIESTAYRNDLLVSSYIDKAYSSNRSVNDLIYKPNATNIIAPYFVNNYVPDYFKYPASYIKLYTGDVRRETYVSKNGYLKRYNTMYDLYNIYKHRKDIIYDTFGNIIANQYAAPNTVTTLLNTLCKEVTTHQLSNFYGINKKVYQKNMYDNNIGITLNDIPVNVYKPAAANYLNTAAFQLPETFITSDYVDAYNLFNLYRQSNYMTDWNSCTIVNKYQIDKFSTPTYKHVTIPFSKNFIKLLKDKGVNDFTEIIKLKRELIFQYKDKLQIDELNEYVDNLILSKFV